MVLILVKMAAYVKTLSDPIAVHAPSVQPGGGGSDGTVTAPLPDDAARLLAVASSRTDVHSSNAAVVPFEGTILPAGRNGPVKLETKEIKMCTWTETTI